MPWKTAPRYHIADTGPANIDCLWVLNGSGGWSISPPSSSDQNKVEDPHNSKDWMTGGESGMLGFPSQRVKVQTSCETKLV
jgi:hypothetical protein